MTGEGLRGGTSLEVEAGGDPEVVGGLGEGCGHG